MHVAMPMLQLQLFPEPFGMADVDDRARFHAARFREKSAAAVLHRYELQRAQMSRPQLEQHAFHVASWLVALPRDEITQDHSGLSVVTLFVRYLESLDGSVDGPVDTRLARILSRVSQTIPSLPGAEAVGMQLQKLISKHMPLDALVPEDCSLADEKRAECEDAEAKAVRLMQRAIQRWQNSDSRETYVNSLEQELAESEGPATLRRILRRAVAALSPPRRKGNSDSFLACSSQSDLASKDLQVRLRSVVLACLDGLDLTDSSLAPALQRLQAHVQKFQELLVTESSVASQKQWLRLQAKCAAISAEALLSPSTCSTILCVDDNERTRKLPECNLASDGQQEEGSRTRRTCRHGKVKSDCKRCSGCPHGRLERFCAKCNGCPHGRVKTSCRLCCPCPHGRIKGNCAKCNGCPHGRLKGNCAKCNGCPHGRRKTKCRLCRPCPHGKLEQRCAQCHPCPHGQLAVACRQCHGCPHGKLERYCAKCHPCPHGQLAADCRECSGCPHGRVKRRCRKCKVFQQ